MVIMARAQDEIISGGVNLPSITNNLVGHPVTTILQNNGDSQAEPHQEI